MQSTRLTAASVGALLALMLIGATLAGCKAREVVANNGTDNGNGNSNGNGNTGTPSPELLAEIRQLKDDKRDLEEQNQILQDQLDDARNDWNEKNREVEALQAQKSTLQSTNADLDTRIRALEGEKTELAAKIKDLETELANMSSVPVNPTPEDVTPETTGNRPEPGEGMVAHPLEAGFGFDYPDGWTVEPNHGMDANEYQLSGPNGEQMRITVWAYLKSEPEVLAGEAWSARVEELNGKDITPTTEVEPQAIEAGISGKETYHCQLLFDMDGEQYRHRIAAAALAVSEGGPFGAWYTVAVEYTWPATSDESLATYDKIIASMWVE